MLLDSTRQQGATTHHYFGHSALADPAAFATWLRDLRGPALARRPAVWRTRPSHAVEYLGRYTHRVAISNERLVSHTNGVVRFRWRDYADGDRVKIMTLAAEEFIRRLLLHVVPGGFVRIRHFGFLANRTRRAKLARADYEAPLGHGTTVNIGSNPARDPSARPLPAVAATTRPSGAALRWRA